MFFTQHYAPDRFFKNLLDKSRLSEHSVDEASTSHDVLMMNVFALCEECRFGAEPGRVLTVALRVLPDSDAQNFTQVLLGEKTPRAKNRLSKHHC